ncbi:uncharacterized protein MELLADRAFT_92526 [Melampsora larici-populina 98AG31]|uniref:Uncharacterized protein n=1 Tax=Melampsora larici-populina (strain 98AG31 / pathotype 3-4-7) TaxID=747676 RepID=F4S1V7_MELLP|nr:uncharacterized protein MELLADRAFT_92526 [Melampsora larici-populina 98AG31]EGG01259.1 hypothetical protein MELLADRAFT_92526 [Melampsora larici-populina 98AG31]
MVIRDHAEECVTPSLLARLYFSCGYDLPPEYYHFHNNEGYEDEDYEDEDYKDENDDEDGDEDDEDEDDYDYDYEEEEDYDDHFGY